MAFFVGLEEERMKASRCRRVQRWFLAVIRAGIFPGKAAARFHAYRPQVEGSQASRGRPSDGVFLGPSLRDDRRGPASGHGAFSGGRGLGRGRRRLPSFLQVVAAMGTIGEIRLQFPGALGAGEGWRDRRRLPGSGLVDARLGRRWYEIGKGGLALPA